MSHFRMQLTNTVSLTHPFHQRKENKSMKSGGGRERIFPQYVDINKWIFDMIHCSGSKGIIMIY